MYSPNDEEAMMDYEKLKKQKEKKNSVIPKNRGLPPLGKEGNEGFYKK